MLAIPLAICLVIRYPVVVDFSASSGNDELGLAGINKLQSSGELVTTPKYRFKQKTIIFNVTFSPDSKYVAAGNQNGTVSIWEVSTGKLYLEAKGEGASGRLVFSPDSQIFLTSFSNGVGVLSRTMKAWNLRSRKELFSVSEGGPIYSILADGQFLTVEKSVIRFWDLKTGKKLRDKYVTDVPILTGVSVGPAGSVFATRNPAKDLMIRNLATGEVISTLKSPGKRIETIRFRNDDKKIAGKTMDKALCVWDCQSGKIEYQTRLDSPPTHPVFSADGRWLAVGTISSNPQVYVINIEESRVSCVVKNLPKWIQGIDFNSDSSLLAIATLSDVFVYDLKKSKR